jgi:biopolymer transport protein ExbD
MVRTGLIALSVVVFSSAVSCKGKSGDGAKKTAEGDKPAEAPPRIPAGTVHVALPKVDAKGARRVSDAKAFVTIAKDGALGHGAVAAGADPYKGMPHDPNKTLEEELFAAKPATAPPPPPPDTQDDPPPPEPEPDVVRPQGQYKMKGPDDDAQLARQQAIDQARDAGILGTTALDDVNIYGGLLGGEPTHAYAKLDTEPGRVDVLVLADREVNARAAVLVLDQLASRDVALAVEGGAAPDAIGLRFAKRPDLPEHISATVSFWGDRVTVMLAGAIEPTHLTRPTAGGALDVQKLAAALKPSPMTPVTAMVQIDLDDKVTVQELAELLGTLAAVGAPSVQITSMDYAEMAGGFGYGISGTGPGGTGTGWGMIGTGRYGTIGGNGKSGYGVGGGSRGSAPKVKIGQPNATGDLDKAIIRRYIRRNIAKISYCYEKELLADPELEGTVNAQFLISATGLVASATANGVSSEVSSCVEKVILAIEFPKPKGGGVVQVNYPFIFKSAE